MPDCCEVTMDVLGLQDPFEIDTRGTGTTRPQAEQQAGSVLPPAKSYRNNAIKSCPHHGEVDGDGNISLHHYEPPVGPNHVKQHEKPWHRMAAIMLLSGFTSRQVAESAGLHVATITDVRRQRWFQDLMVLLARERGDAVQGMLESEALASVTKLVDLRDFAESPKVQLDAARTLLEHAKGKPTQKVLSISATTTYSSEREEAAEIMRELESLQQRRKTQTPL